jgi:enoyl-CoA hydratase
MNAAVQSGDRSGLVLIDRGDDGVWVLTLNDPDRRNAMGSALVEQLLSAVESFSNEASARVLVLTGTGSAFCAGADLRSLASAGSVEDSAAGLRDIYQGFLAVASCPKPVIAAVNGPAVGAGMNLALAADIRLVTPQARFDTRFAQLGIHPGGGHTWMLQRLVGSDTARAMLLFGQVVSGAHAVSLGLATACVDPPELLSTALTFAGRAAGYAPEILADIKRTLGDTAAMDTHGEAIERELVDQARSVRSEAFRAKLGLTAPE